MHSCLLDWGLERDDVLRAIVAEHNFLIVQFLHLLLDHVQRQKHRGSILRRVRNLDPTSGHDIVHIRFAVREDELHDLAVGTCHGDAEFVREHPGDLHLNFWKLRVWWQLSQQNSSQIEVHIHFDAAQTTHRFEAA